MPSQKKSESASRGVTSTSQSLLVRLRQNDSEAWDRLISLYTPLVCYWCRKLGLPEQDMPDVVQEVFKSVAGSIDRFRKERPQDTFRGWLRTIARSKVADLYRRQKDQPKAAGGTVAQHYLSEFPADELDDDSVHEPAHNALFLRALEMIRGEFHERTWQAFWRTAVDGQKPNDVAEELEMRPGTIRVAKSRVLHRLRQELGDLIE